MNTLLLILALVLLVVALAVVVINGLLRTELAAVRADRDRLENSIRNNLRAIRAQVAYGFPEAVALCDALESRLQARCRVDLAELERRLVVLRRAHNRTLLDAAGRGQAERERVAMPWMKGGVA